MAILFAALMKRFQRAAPHCNEIERIVFGDIPRQEHWLQESTNR